MMMQKPMTEPNSLATLAQMFELMAPQTKKFTTELAGLSVACNTPIEDDDELDRRMQMIDALFSYAATEDDIPAILAHMLSDQVYEYEQKNLVLPTVTPAKALAFFMSENSVKQKDLKHIATQSIISEILNSKRKMTVEHIKAFSAHFGVPETPFLG